MSDVSRRWRRVLRQHAADEPTGTARLRYGLIGAAAGGLVGVRLGGQAEGAWIAVTVGAVVGAVLAALIGLNALVPPWLRSPR